MTVPVPKITRRLDTKRCNTNQTCPAVFELEDGRVAIIGSLEPVTLASGETVIDVPHDVLAEAAQKILGTSSQLG